MPCIGSRSSNSFHQALRRKIYTTLIQLGRTQRKERMLKIAVLLLAFSFPCFAPDDNPPREQATMGVDDAYQ